MGDIILVTSGKGGVGKSTISSCIGRELSKMGKKTVLVELDSGLRCLDIMLNVSENVVYDIGDVFSKRCPLEKAVVKASENDILFLLPASSSFDQNPTAEDVSEICRVLSRSHDFVIIDAPAGLGKGFDRAFRICDMAILVVTPDMVCVRDAEKMTRRLDDLGIKTQRLLINKVKENFTKLNILPDLDYVIDQTATRLIGVVPEDDNVTVKTSMGSELNKNSLANECFRRIAKRICNENIPLAMR